MSLFIIYNNAGQGIDMRYPGFGMSFQGETYTGVADSFDTSTLTGTATHQVTDNPVVDEHTITIRTYNNTPNQYLLQSFTNSRGGETVFAASGLNITGQFSDLISLDQNYSAMIADADTFYGNDLKDYIFSGMGDDVI